MPGEGSGALQASIRCGRLNPSATCVRQRRTASGGGSPCAPAPPVSRPPPVAILNLMSRATVHKPSYLHLATEELRRRVDAAWELMASPCRVCPRGCKVDRRADDQRGFCRIGARAVISSFAPHFGEEPPLVGRGGAGAIFFPS